jgi:tetratricopeptide (TPR) repeat protein
MNHKPTRLCSVIVGALAMSLFTPVAFADPDQDRCITGAGEAAVAACSNIIAAGDGPEIAWAYFNRGRAYFKEKMYGGAVSDLTDALRLKPTDLEALENRGLAFLAMEDFKHAIGDFDKLIELQPVSVSGYRERCAARAASGRDLDDAMEDCNKALSLKPGDAGTLDARCLVQMRAAAYPAAIADCSAAINANPMLASSLYLRGVAKIKTGDLAHGDADISTAKALDNDVAHVFSMYGVKP